MMFCMDTDLPICDPMMNVIRLTRGTENARTIEIMYGLRAERHGPGSADPTGKTLLSSAHSSAVLGSGALTNVEISFTSLRSETFESVSGLFPDSSSFGKESLSDFGGFVNSGEFIS